MTFAEKWNAGPLDKRQLSEYVDSCTDLRDEIVTNFRHRVAAVVEQTLRQFIASGHADHFHQIARLNISGEWDVDRFICQHDRATLTLRHAMKMDGNILTWTVTPEIGPPIEPSLA